MRRRSGVVLFAGAGHGARGARLLLERRRQQTPQTREGRVSAHPQRMTRREGESEGGRERERREAGGA